MGPLKSNIPNHTTQSYILMHSRGETGNDIMETYNSHLFPNYAPYSVIPQSGKGSTLKDTSGKEYIDFSGGIAVNALGHCHPELVATLREQAGKLWHTSNYFVNIPAVKLAEKLIRLTFADRVFFGNSGTEANEAALKLARKYAVSEYGTHKTGIVSTHDSFHGRSLFTVTVGGRQSYKEGYHPLPEGIRHVPFNDADALVNAVDDTTCAVIVEPIQGEGGVIPATREFLNTARSVCQKHKAVLIFDEIQCGVGRTGHLFAYMLYGITPDILTTAKALGCGLPISATLTTHAIAAAFQPGSHGSTFGGNPLACAVSGNALDIIASPPFLSRVRKTHAAFVDQLTRLIRRYSVSEEVRGHGLLLGIQLNADYAGNIKKFCNICLDERLLILQAGNGVIRLAPALNITEDEMNEGFKRFESALRVFTTPIRD